MGNRGGGWWHGQLFWISHGKLLVFCLCAHPGPCLLHVELMVCFCGVLWPISEGHCVRAAQASQKCHCTTGWEISWCLSSGSQQMPLFSSRQIQGFKGNLAGLQSGICLSFQELPEKKCKQSLWQSLVCIEKSFVCKCACYTVLNHCKCVSSTNEVGCCKLLSVPFVFRNSPRSLSQAIP